MPYTCDSADVIEGPWTPHDGQEHPQVVLLPHKWIAMVDTADGEAPLTWPPLSLLHVKDVMSWKLLVKVQLSICMIHIVLEEGYKD